eukprot:TRINITY_DN375_c4_g1_i2.p1 TRINITY_DN375_c4_g1~~TRINITY_DN375_c4_g1_i2.p1  ORF type:complete len:455 (+),score=227.51 TRINITY_DN375_c4_g1_i2:124-1365(+)
MPGASVQEKRIALAFMRFLERSPHVQDSQREVVSDLLKDCFELGGDLDSLAVPATLEEIWEKGAPKQTEQQLDEKKWQEFIDVLRTKGYFKGVEEGSDEYNARLEKAKAKFIARSNPYDGMTPEQLKQKGNELMAKGQHKDAIGYYTKAIELDPETAVYYGNRAAAYTHINQFNEAVRDCEKATSLKPDYTKAYSRLGTAYFYQHKYREAVVAYKKACELEPGNETYKADLAAAEQKASMPQMPAMPGGMDFGAMSEMMNNPQFMNMAQNFMQNPEFSKLVQNMAMNMGMAGPGGEPDLAKMQQMFSGGAGQLPEGEGGMVPTPFGAVSKEQLEALQNDPKIKDNPKFQAIQEEVKREGPMAIMRHMNDPEVIAAMSDFSKIFSQQPGGAAAGGGGGAVQDGSAGGAGGAAAQ